MSHRCPDSLPGDLRGVAVEVRVGSYGDRVLALPEPGAGSTWGFVSAVPSGSVAVGEAIEVSGAKVSQIEDFLGDRGRLFPYANLMRSRGYCFESRGGSVAVVGESSSPLDRLRVWGAAARARIAQVLPPVPAALSAGAFLGGDAGVWDDLKDAAQRAGLSHALALSGFNVAVFAGAVDFALGKFAPRALRILGGASAGWLLVALAGLPASGVRAALAWTIGSLARLSFRRAEAPRALLYAALAYSWANPLALAFDLSLQLSLLACLGIAAWAAPAAEKLVWVPGLPTLRESVAATLAATAATLPISAWSFGQVSVVGPAANAAVAYAVPLMMWAGIVAVFASASPPIAGVLSPVIALPANIFAAVASWGGSLPFSAAPVALSAPEALLVSIFLAGAALASIARARERSRVSRADEVARLRRAIEETS